MKKEKILEIRLTEELLQKLKQQAEKEESTASAIARKAIKKYLEVK
jgi:predicted transcriptional regulator